jgi:DNA-binding MarR family transcriptional regulator
MGAKRVRPSTMYLLHQTGQAMRAKLERALRGHQMTGIKYTVLAVIGESGNISSAELSRRFFVTPQTMQKIVEDLLLRGLILRREDTNTRRILRLALTLRGRKTLEECERIADDVEEQALADFSDGNLAELRTLLQSLRSNLLQVEPDARAKGRGEARASR